MFQRVKSCLIASLLLSLVGVPTVMQAAAPVMQQPGHLQALEIHDREALQAQQEASERLQRFLKDPPGDRSVWGKEVHRLDAELRQATWAANGTYDALQRAKLQQPATTPAPQFPASSSPAPAPGEVVRLGAKEGSHNLEELKELYEEARQKTYDAARRMTSAELTPEHRRQVEDWHDRWYAEAVRLRALVIEGVRAALLKRDVELRAAGRNVQSVEEGRKRGYYANHAKFLAAQQKAAQALKVAQKAREEASEEYYQYPEATEKAQKKP